MAARIAQGLASVLPRGWTAQTEAPLLSAALCLRLGFRVQADLMLSGPAGERIVLEIEISRADPIANPARFFLARHMGALSLAHGFAGMVTDTPWHAAFLVEAIELDGKTFRDSGTCGMSLCQPKI